MKRIAASLAAALALITGGVTPAGSGPTGGDSSANVEWLKWVPFDAGTATGARLVGKYLFVTSWRNFSIYDVTDALNPTLLSTTPFGFQFENEDVSTNGKIMLFSESLPRSVLHVWDVEDKTLPVEIATLPGAGDHTSTCILDCKWAYGSDGSLVDLRDPSNPEEVANWHQLIGGIPGGAHDVDEFKRGFIVVSTISTPLLIVDVRDPLKPKIIAQGEHPAPGQWLFHSGHWPNRGRDRFVLMEGEGTSGPFLTYDTTRWEKTRTVTLVDSYSVEGSTASSHWFDEHPRFRDGGLVVIGWYGEGTRFLKVSPEGQIKEIGWYEPHVQRSGFSSYWVTKDIVYAIDLYYGIDILRFGAKA